MAQRDFKNFKVFVDGLGLGGVVEKAQLPDLEMKVDDWAGGGMAGPVENPLGMEKMEAVITVRDVNDALMSQFGKPNGPNLIIRAAAVDNQAVTSAVKITMNGLNKKLGLGELKRGDATMQEYSFNLHYFKYEVGSAVKFEVDLWQNIMVVDGVDLMADERAALGG